jgi:hypothetical protein
VWEGCCISHLSVHIRILLVDTKYFWIVILLSQNVCHLKYKRRYQEKVNMSFNKLFYTGKKDHSFYNGIIFFKQWNQYNQYTYHISAFQLDFEIFRTIVSFIKISSGHSLIIKLIFIKFFRTIWKIGGQMSWDQCLAESMYIRQTSIIFNWCLKACTKKNQN